MDQIKTRLRKFIAEELQLNDLVAVIRTGGNVGALQQFTTDKRMLNRAVDQLRWNVCSRMGPSVLPRVESVGEPSCYDESRLLSLKVLRFILDSMGRLPGRKSMILLSDNLPIQREEKSAGFCDNASIVDKVKHNIVLSLGENEYQQAMRDGLPDAVRRRFDMPAKKPGSDQVRIAVRDRSSAKIGSAGQFIEVPDLNNKRAALSGIVLRSGSVASTPATVMATPPGKRFPLNSNPEFAFFVYNPTPDLVLQTKLFRDGKVVEANADRPVGVTNKDSLGRSLVTNVMRLTPDLEPGNYSLQVLLIDKAARDKRSPAASQWADFEIVK